MGKLIKTQTLPDGSLKKQTIHFKSLSQLLKVIGRSGIPSKNTYDLKKNGFTQFDHYSLEIQGDNDVGSDNRESGQT